MNNLPPELLEIIVRNMTPRNIRALMSTSRSFRNSNVLRRVYNQKIHHRRRISERARRVVRNRNRRGGWASRQRVRSN